MPSLLKPTWHTELPVINYSQCLAAATAKEYGAASTSAGLQEGRKYDAEHLSAHVWGIDADGMWGLRTLIWKGVVLHRAHPL